MLNLGYIYDRLPFLIGTDQYGQMVTPQNFSDNIKWANLKLIDKYIKKFEETREISNNLRPFFKTLGTPEEPPLTMDTTGRCPFPSDYYYFSSAVWAKFMNTCGGFNVTYSQLEWVDNSSFSHRISSKLKYPTKDYPIATYCTIKTNGDYVGGFQVAPIMKKIAFTYLRRPNDPIFDYTISGATVIYNEAGSSIEWPESAMDDFMELLVFAYARNSEDQLDIQISKGEGA